MFWLGVVFVFCACFWIFHLCCFGPQKVDAEEVKLQAALQAEHQSLEDYQRLSKDSSVFGPGFAYFGFVTLSMALLSPAKQSMSGRKSKNTNSENGGVGSTSLLL